MSTTMSAPLPLIALDFPRAARALAALLRDPDDLPQVFRLIESISGTAALRLLHGFRRDATGARLLRERPDIVKYLGDRAWLQALPHGSLGREYLAFVERENISPEGIREASNRTDRHYSRADVEYMRCRMRDTHDLWHAVTGYQGDLLGELSLLAFTLGQHWNSAIALIIVAGLVRGWGDGNSSTIVAGFRRGRAAAWLPAQDWESLLALPVDEVRARLKVDAPPRYTPVRSDQLRAQGRLAQKKDAAHATA